MSHLYLKSRLGIINFSDRIKIVTDGPNDGGIDAFYIDARAKVIHLLQAKFRANSENFETEQMSAYDLLKMDVSRITKGQKKDEQGNSYNDQIKALQKAIAKVPDLANYQYKVVLLGNTEKLSKAALSRLVEGFHVEQFPHDRVYAEMLFPVINGTYFSEPNLSIEIDLSNVSGGQSHLDYNVRAQNQNINIKLLFVPTREIGRIMNSYKNSVLRFNPRSFLELSDNPVNRDIEASIRTAVNNEFALFNNGVTIISDETKGTSNTAKRGKAQIVLKNPQLVNGGQTAHTLGRIYSECANSGDFNQFKSKEVLLRVISFEGSSQANQSSRLTLIGDISKASNSQTKVDESDRRSNDPVQLKLQDLFFKDHGLYYERKQGEFHDGIHAGYIDKALTVDREKLIRVGLASSFQVRQARSSIKKYFADPNALNEILKVGDIEQYAFGYELLSLIDTERKAKPTSPNDRYNTKLYGQGLRYGQYAVLATCIFNGLKHGLNAQAILKNTLTQWRGFESWASKEPANAQYKKSQSFDFPNYYKGATINDDLKSYNFVYPSDKKSMSQKNKNLV